MVQMYCTNCGSARKQKRRGQTMRDPADCAAELILLQLNKDNCYVPRTQHEGLRQLLEFADIIRAEYAELMPCGHTRACLQTRGPTDVDPMERTMPVVNVCTACEREAGRILSLR